VCDNLTFVVCMLIITGELISQEKCVGKHVTVKQERGASMDCFQIAAKHYD